MARREKRFSSSGGQRSNGPRRSVGRSDSVTASGVSIEEISREADRIMRESESAMKKAGKGVGLPNVPSNQEDTKTSHRSTRRSPKNKSNAEASGSALSAVRQLSRSSVDPSQPRGLAGLQNLGNTCFMNSTLQCLFNTPPLLKYFTSDQYRPHICSTSPMRGQLAMGFAETLSAVYSSKPNSSVNPSVLKRLVGKWAPHLSGYAQQDSQEFMRFLLDGLSEDLNNKKRPIKPMDMTEAALEKMSIEAQSDYWWSRHLALNSSFITETFSGQLMSAVECGTCHTRSYCFDPFYDLSLPIPGSKPSGGGTMSRLIRSSFGKKDPHTASSGRHAEECTLEDCLRAFTAEETIDGDNRPMCTKCKKRRTSVKRITVHRFPPILVLHIKRFQSLRGGKLETRVKFPMSGLDMSTFSCKNQGEVEPSYDLYAVSNHIGGLHGGHYTAHCVNPGIGKWFHYNDSHVGRSEEKELGQDGLPYVLFYKRSDIS